MLSIMTELKFNNLVIQHSYVDDACVKFISNQGTSSGTGPKLFT